MRMLLIPMALALAAVPASAQDAGRNAAERARDRTEMREDRRASAGDAVDLAWVDAAREDYAAARERGDTKLIRKIDKRVGEYLAAETGEARGEAARSRGEKRAGNREVRGDRRELREKRREEAAPEESKDERRDTRDARDDRRDRRDATVDTAQHERLVAIQHEWKGLAGETDDASLDRKTALLDELVGIAHGETRKGQSEKREDRRETREDAGE